MQIQKGLVQVQVLLPENGGFHSVLGFTPLILLWLLPVLEKGVATALFLHFQETLGALVLLLCQSMEKVAHALQSHIVAVKIEAQREVSVEGPQGHVGQAMDGGLHPRGKILTNLGAHS